VNLGVGSGTNIYQVAQAMLELEVYIAEAPPDAILVYGDVNATVAASMVGNRRGILCAHVEAGLRSGDRRMPEELNRILTDHMCEMHFTPSSDADENLLFEGIGPAGVHLVGNVMIDSLVTHLPAAEAAARGLNFDPPFGLVTLHRPATVDDVGVLRDVIRTLDEIAERLPLIFPVHPRTRQQIDEMDTLENLTNLRPIEPLDYLSFLGLERLATVVITDSGGIQEETSYLGVPCITVRDSTERPVTVSMGTNTIVGFDMDRLRKEMTRILDGKVARGSVPPSWDGHAGERIAKLMSDRLGN
jgi:UDP-N-acetylglucosamine 2-epimerase (non-hydrolysing)